MNFKEVKKNCRMAGNAYTKLIYRENLKIDPKVILKNDQESYFPIVDNPDNFLKSDFEFSFGILKGQVFDFEVNILLIEELEYLQSKHQVEVSLIKLKELSIINNFEKIENSIEMFLKYGVITQNIDG